MWNRIDLHQHTENEITSNGKKPKSEYTHKKFLSLLKDQNVSLKAVTNHNTLNLVDHVKYSLICEKMNISYLPGVEIDYDFGGGNFHAITILNPKTNIIDYASELKRLVKEKGNIIYLTKDDFAILHKDIEYIFIPHVMKSKGLFPSSSEPNISDATDWVTDVIRNGLSMPVIFENTKDYHKYTVIDRFSKRVKDDNLEFATYTGSDSKFESDLNKDEISLNRIKYKINASPSYRGLELAVRNPISRFLHEDSIINRNRYISKIAFMNEKMHALIDIELSPALNVIIGSSGSGKTLLLNEIYRSIRGEDLKDVVSATDSKKSKGKNAYYSLIGEESSVKVICSDNVAIDQLKIIEIPNIYTEIMKYVNDSQELGKLFNISNIDYISQCLNNFKRKIIKYANHSVLLNEAILNGDLEIKNLISSIEFLDKNKLIQSNYDLKIEDVLNINENVDKNIGYTEYILKYKEFVTKYFKLINKLLDFEYDDLINEIINNHIMLLTKIEEKSNEFKKEKTENNLLLLIQNNINNSISMVLNLLGQREQTYRNNETILQNSKNSLINEIKKSLLYEKKLNDMYIVYPFEEMDALIKQNNSNDIARFSLDIEKMDLNDIQIDDDAFFVTKGITTKLKNIKKNIPNINLNDSSSIKTALSFIINEGIDVGLYFINSPKLNLEMKVDKVWKKATEINQGTIAKISMKYYFENLMRTNHPDVIFIDQPENDVDKDFLTNTLSKFILNQKNNSQIIITTHDPILTINSDANMIIQSEIDENNNFVYSSYPLEYEEEGKPITDDVANVLDGNKHNIKVRYQIYGGILKYDN